MIVPQVGPQNKFDRPKLDETALHKGRHRLNTSALSISIAMKVHPSRVAAMPVLDSKVASWTIGLIVYISGHLPDLFHCPKSLCPKHVTLRSTFNRCCICLNSADRSNL